MKNLTIILFLGISFLTFSKEDIPSESLKYIPQVRVMKDSLDLSVAKGKSKIIADFYYQVEVSDYVYEYRKCNAEQLAYYSLDGKDPLRIKPNGTIEIQIDTAVNYILFEKCFNCKVHLFEKVYLEHYKFQSQHSIVLEVYIPLKSSQQNIIVDKPVIYAYSEKDLNFTLNLKAKGALTFTYPQLPEDNTWKMKTTLSGNLINEKGVEYPYLFWEAKQNESSFNGTKANSNELIAGKDLVTYFEKELSKLGLNAKEKTDFITFWCPKFVDSKMVQIQFYVDDNCSLIGDLDISPKPDNLRRIYVTFQKNPVVVTDFVPQELNVKAIQRNGFTVVEWGGSDLGSYIP